MPAAVLAVYRPDPDAPQRQVTSQRERDDQALALAEGTAVVLAAIARTLADDRLHPASRGRLEWFAAEIRKAAGEGRAARVAELVDRLQGERPRRQHWWNGEPAAITVSPDYDDDDDLDDDDDEDQATGLPAAPPRLAIAAAPEPAPQPLTWTSAIASLGWQLEPGAEGRCELVIRSGHCAAAAARHITGGWACEQHYQQLASLITGRAR